MIHQYKLNGYNIVLDKYSGSVHVVDPVVYELIRLYDQALEKGETLEVEAENTPLSSKDVVRKVFASPSSKFLNPRAEKSIVDILMEMLWEEPVTEKDLELCLEDVKGLIESGQLFTVDKFADKANVLKGDGTIVKALCLHIAHTCNLNCSYCFASQGSYSQVPVGKGFDFVEGQKMPFMSLEVGKAALDFLVENSKGRTNLDVDFFGGEPLMNFQVVKDLVAYGRSLEPVHGKKFRFTLTTNGMLIDEDVIDFCNKEIYNVVISLDGRKEVHDRLRKTHGGEGSYDKILPKFKALVESREGKGYYMRGTYTHYNTDFLTDIRHMADLGFKELSMEPVVCAPGDPYELTEDDLPVLFKEYENLALEMRKREKQGNGFSFYHYTVDLTHGPCVYKSIAGCGSGTEYLAVTPWGELYPCHQFVGEEEYSMGSVFQGITNISLREDFRSCNVYAREECKDCWAGFYCAGGCAANAYHSTGDIKGIYEYGCKLFKKRMECAIMMEVDRKLEGLDS